MGCPQKDKKLTYHHEDQRLITKNPSENSGIYHCFLLGFKRK